MAYKRIDSRTFEALTKMMRASTTAAGRVSVSADGKTLTATVTGKNAEGRADDPRHRARQTVSRLTAIRLTRRRVDAAQGWEGCAVQPGYPSVTGRSGRCPTLQEFADGGASCGCCTRVDRRGCGFSDNLHGPWRLYAKVRGTLSFALVLAGALGSERSSIEGGDAARPHVSHLSSRS